MVDITNIVIILSAVDDENNFRLIAYFIPLPTMVGRDVFDSRWFLCKIGSGTYSAECQSCGKGEHADQVTIIG